MVLWCPSVPSRTAQRTTARKGRGLIFLQVHIFSIIKNQSPNATLKPQTWQIQSSPSVLMWHSCFRSGVSPHRPSRGSHGYVWSAEFIFTTIKCDYLSKSCISSCAYHSEMDLSGKLKPSVSHCFHFSAVRGCSRGFLL